MSRRETRFDDDPDIRELEPAIRKAFEAVGAEWPMPGDILVWNGPPMDDEWKLGIPTKVNTATIKAQRRFVILHHLRRVRELIAEGDASGAARRAYWLGLHVANERDLFRWRPMVYEAEKDKANRKKAALIATKEREARKNEERSEWSRINATLRQDDPEMPRTERARVIATRLRLPDPRPVYDYLSKREKPARRK